MVKKRRATRASDKKAPRSKPQPKKVSKVCRLLRQWRESCPENDWEGIGPPLTREQLALKSKRCESTIRNWERDREPRVSDLRQLEAIKPGLIRLLFPEAFSLS